MRRLLHPSAILALLLGGMLGATISVSAIGYAAQGPATISHTAAPARPGGIVTGIHQLLNNLVQQRVISPTQADAIQRQADAGSINPKALVDSGVVTDAQMHTIADRIQALKQANR